MATINFAQNAKEQKTYITVGSAWKQTDKSGKETGGIGIIMGNQQKDSDGNRVEALEELKLKAGDKLYLNVNQYKTSEKHPDYRVRVEQTEE